MAIALSIALLFIFPGIILVLLDLAWSLIKIGIWVAVILWIALALMGVSP
tara:strand:- start:2327 stop:2476 length:150 start_codon:yes stop_codon:yes gene_type:complete